MLQPSLPGGRALNFSAKVSTVGAETTSSGREFQWSMTRCEKNCLQMSVLAGGLNSFSLWTRSDLVGRENRDSELVLYRLLMYLYVSTRSVLYLLTLGGSRSNSSLHNRWQCLCTFSRASTSFFNQGFHVIF